MTGWRQWRGALWGWLSHRSIRQLLLGVGAVILLLSGVFGGLRDARAPHEARPADTAHAATPFEVTITQVNWADDLGESFEPSELGRFLVVFATIRTDQDESVNGLVVREALRIRGLSGFAKAQFSEDIVASEDADPKVVVTADRVPLGEIGPGLSYEVAFIWQQDDAESLPTSVELET